MTPPPEETLRPQAAVRARTPLPDAWRIEVFRRADRPDPDGRELLEAARELGISGLSSARLGRGVLLSPHLSAEEIERVRMQLLCDPVLDEGRVTAPGKKPTVRRNTHRALVARKPGVMDPVANTVARVILDAGLLRESAGRDLHVTTFRAWEFEGDVGSEELHELGTRVLANETIEELRIDEEGLPFAAPSAASSAGRVEVQLRNLDDQALQALSRSGQFSLDLYEMRAVQSHFVELDREPTLAELETIAQTWSEHCKHKTFTGRIDCSDEMGGERIENLLKETIKRATLELDKPWCISVFHDNAGIVEFDAGWDVCFKVETHNHPSAIDPYGGAGTGIGGVIRDVLGVGLGARPIANTDAFFVGPHDLPASALPKGCLHPRRILRGVVAGVRDYGNRMGIPTVSGGLWVDEGYVANPLVYAGTVGLLRREFADKRVHPGDRIVVAGGRTGLDGIHGATFSSVELHEESEKVSAAAVQIGDPITEKKLCEGLLRARDRGLYRAITDCGAGGLSSAVGEMSEACGAEVDLDLVPLKYPGLAPHEIWISEAQERMVLAVPPEAVDECLATFAADEVEATVIGSFTDSGRLVLRHEGEVVGDLDLHFLHEGTPKPLRRAHWVKEKFEDPGVPACEDWEATLLALLASPNISSREWIVRQYDHEVQGMSVVKPLVGLGLEEPADGSAPMADPNDSLAARGPSDGSVLKPLPESRKGIALGCGANPSYGRLDPGAMAEAVIDEALRNVVAVGGDPEHTSLLDNFSWGNCDEPDRLGALVLAAQGCYRAALAFGTPFISGKDSLNNEYREGGVARSIPPTLLVSALSIVPDVSRATTMDAKRAGSGLWLVGPPTRAELGGSAWFAHLDLAGGTVPRPDLDLAPSLLRALHQALRSGLALACHDLSEGGLAIAAAEMAFAGGLGLDVSLAEVRLAAGPDGHDGGAAVDGDALRAFSESCTRFLVEVAPKDEERFRALLGPAHAARIGTVTADGLLTLRSVHGRTLCEVPVARLARAHRSGFQG